MTYKPLPDELEIKVSPIRTPLGGFINHSEKNNCEKVQLRFTTEDHQPLYNFNKYNLITIKDIKGGEELTLNYTFYKI
jgi:SET domain-containing protein